MTVFQPCGVCRFQFCLYASKAYLKRHPDSTLQDHDWLIPDWFVPEGVTDWLPPVVWDKKARSGAKTKMSSNNTMAIVEAAKSGLGVAPLPCMLGDPEKNLVRIVEPTDDFALDLWILTHPGLRHTARVRALMTYIYESLLQQSDLIEGRISGP